MTWRDDLQPASFRGVPFEVLDDSGPAGRKTQLHEFVQRDNPFVEDLGRATREIRLVAFVSGADCFARRDALLAALDTAGPGELVHPWLGKLTVTAGDGCEYSHARGEGGVVRFTLVFIEGGDAGFPAGVPNTAQQVVKANAGFIEGAQAGFSRAMEAVNAGRAKVSVLQRALQAPYELASRYFGEALRAVDGVAGFVDLLVASPAGYFSLFGSLSSAASRLQGLSETDYGSALRAPLMQVQAARSISNTPAVAGGAATVVLAGAGQQLVRDALLAQVADQVSSLPVRKAPAKLAAVASLDQQIERPLERADVPVADDVVALRDEVDAAFWEAALTASPARFVQVENLRQALYRHLTQVAGSGVSLVQVTPLSVEPALVLAYRRYGDATRDGEIVTRNRIVHPNYVPQSPLQLAQE